MRSLVLVAIVTSLAACGGVSSYRAAPKHEFGWGAGYREEQISAGQYKLEYYGFHWQSRALLLQYFNHRASELCAPDAFDVSGSPSGAGPDVIDLLMENTVSANAPDVLLLGTVRCEPGARANNSFKPKPLRGSA